MKKSFSGVIVLLLCIVLVLSACGSNNESQSGNMGNESDNGGNAAPQEKVVLKVPHYKAGANAGAKFFLPQIERFNKKYEGKYEIQIEEVPDDKYRDKIKLLWQQKQLPALVEGGDRQFLEELIANGEMYDLTSWIESNDRMKELYAKESIDFNKKEGNGKIFTQPLFVTRPIGVYYNKELFEKAGITKPISKMTWDEFDQAMQTLKAKGITPLALMTGENAWTTMLTATGFLGNQSGGSDILKSTEVLYDFTSDVWVKTFANAQKWLKEYTTTSAIGAAYADAANMFLSEKTAMIANGPWMAGDFLDTSKASEGFEKKVGYSLFPGGVGIDNLESLNWWIPAGLSKGETDAALAFLEFRTEPEEVYAYMIAEGGFAPNLPSSDEVNAKLNPILGEFNKTAQADLKLLVKGMQDIWPNQIGQSEFGKYLALLANDSMTPEQFAKELTDKAQQFKN